MRGYTTKVHNNKKVYPKRYREVKILAMFMGIFPVLAIALTYNMG
jgi:nitrate reductase NapE component